MYISVAGMYVLVAGMYVLVAGMYVSAAGMYVSVAGMYILVAWTCKSKQCINTDYIAHTHRKFISDLIRLYVYVYILYYHYPHTQERGPTHVRPSRHPRVGRAAPVREWQRGDRKYGKVPSVRERL